MQPSQRHPFETDTQQSSQQQSTQGRGNNRTETPETFPFPTEHPFPLPYQSQLGWRGSIVYSSDKGSFNPREQWPSQKPPLSLGPISYPPLPTIFEEGRQEQTCTNDLLEEDDPDFISPNEPFPYPSRDFPLLPPDPAAWEATPNSSTQRTTPSQLPYVSQDHGILTSGRPSSNAQAIIPTPNGPADRLGFGWPRIYRPHQPQPWHYQHPSAIDLHYLIPTCTEYKSVFPQNFNSFVPQNMPWYTLWLICFWRMKTTLSQLECCALYQYKYREVILGIGHMKEHHIVELWDYLRQGEHAYAFEWERSREFEDSLRNLLNVWLSEACGLPSWGVEEERFGNNSFLNGMSF